MSFGYIKTTLQKKNVESIPQGCTLLPCDGIDDVSLLRNKIP